MLERKLDAVERCVHEVDAFLGHATFQACLFHDLADLTQLSATQILFEFGNHYMVWIDRTQAARDSGHVFVRAVARRAEQYPFVAGRHARNGADNGVYPVFVVRKVDDDTSATR